MIIFEVDGVRYDSSLDTYHIRTQRIYSFKDDTCFGEDDTCSCYNPAYLEIFKDLQNEHERFFGAKFDPEFAMRPHP